MGFHFFHDFMIFQPFKIVEQKYGLHSFLLIVPITVFKMPKKLYMNDSLKISVFIV